MASLDDVLTRLDMLESREEIRDLVSRYCWGADRRDLDVWRSVWAPDAVWSVAPQRAFVGLEEISDAVQRQWTAFPRMLHATSNHRIDLAGEQATGSADVQLLTQLAPSDGRPAAWVVGTGRYTDTYVRIGGQWRISRREASDDALAGPIPSFEPVVRGS
jgi:ketosteroid isomerase-like protein